MEEDAKQARRKALEMSRVRAQQDLQTACDRRSRALLERTIEHIDAELRALG